MRPGGFLRGRQVASSGPGNQAAHRFKPDRLHHSPPVWVRPEQQVGLCHNRQSSAMGLHQRQLDFFRLLVFPCGRSSAPYCELERTSTDCTGVLYCPNCHCIAPIVTVASS
jgi:hypothetical protein